MISRYLISIIRFLVIIPTGQRANVRKTDVRMTACLGERMKPHVTVLDWSQGYPFSSSHLRKWVKFKTTVRINIRRSSGPMKILV